jgi:hypothetical protein
MSSAAKFLKRLLKVFRSDVNFTYNEGRPLPEYLNSATAILIVSISINIALAFFLLTEYLSSRTPISLALFMGLLTFLGSGPINSLFKPMRL